MTNLAFSKATKKQSRLRMALIGPSGSGKTYTALSVASALGERVALIDSERGSASKYAGDPFDFDTLDLQTFEPLTYVAAIEAAAAAGYDVLVIDSLSHAWSGKGGALEQVDMRAGGNKFNAWREVTPMHNSLVEAILTAPMHVIATMRAKTEYAVEQDGGKTKVVKLGLAPVQRDGMEYEFDVVGDIDQKHVLRISKTRCAALDDAVIPNPGAGVAETLKTWLGDGEPLADAKLQKKLDRVIANLTNLDGSRDWAATADKYAQREFRHGRALLTEAEITRTIAEFEGHLAKLQNGTGGKDEAQQALAGATA